MTVITNIHTYMNSMIIVFIFNIQDSDLFCDNIFIHSFIYSIHWHVQNATTPCHSQEILPFLSVMYFFLPSFSTNYCSIFSHLILPSISRSNSQSFLFPDSYIMLFWEFYFLPFSVHAQTNVIYLTLLFLL